MWGRGWCAPWLVWTLDPPVPPPVRATCIWSLQLPYGPSPAPPQPPSWWVSMRCFSPSMGISWGVADPRRLCCSARVGTPDGKEEE